MKSYQEYFSQLVEKSANNKGLQVIEQKSYANSGVWIFKRDGKTVSKIYFNFQRDYASVRTGNGNMYPGVVFKYGEDNLEAQAVAFCVRERYEVT